MKNKYSILESPVLKSHFLEQQQQKEMEKRDDRQKRLDEEKAAEQLVC